VAHSFTRIHVHFVFSTKDRRDTIAREWQPRLWAYIAGICKNHEMICLAVGGTRNHVHILLHLPPKLALAKAVLLVKANSSKWMGEQGIDFSWQEGYGAFSVSASNLDQVTRYIKNKRCTTGKPVSRTNFAHSFGSMAWNTTRNTPLVSHVPPLRGLAAHARAAPPLPRWATFSRPWRDSQGVSSSHAKKSPRRKWSRAFLSMEKSWAARNLAGTGI
jgi:REP-associated tyrosine transposase